MLESFYEVAAQVSFTLLGLWWLVMLGRKTSWEKSPGHRRAALAISLHFALPGIMSLISLVQLDSTILWRLSFGISAAIGACASILIQGGFTAMLRHGALIRASHAVAFALYVCIAAVALFADVVREAGVHPQRLDAILLAILFFVGLCLTWLVYDE